jgi:hypothetical protein
MADTIQPVSKAIPKPDGIVMGESQSTLTTPNPSFGRYFGSGEPGSNAVGMGSLMGKKSKSK